MLNNGCMCCTVKDDLVNMLNDLVSTSSCLLHHYAMTSMQFDTHDLSFHMFTQTQLHLLQQVLASQQHFRPMLCATYNKFVHAVLAAQ